MTEQELAEVYVQLRRLHATADEDDLAELILARLTADQVIDLAVEALAVEETMDSTQQLALRYVRGFVERMEAGG